MKKTTLALMAFLFTIFSFSQVSVGTEIWTNEAMPVEPYYEYLTVKQYIMQIELMHLVRLPDLNILQLQNRLGK